MKKQRILLTGGTGMVGRNLLESPMSQLYDVIAPTRSQLDLTSLCDVRKFIDSYTPDLIIHSAGKVGGIHANIREPVSFLLENLDMGRNVVWAARLSGIKKLINLGSSCMYPRNHNDPLSEDMVLKGELEPTNEGYALAKVVTARLCEYIRRENPLYEYKTLIPCNLYGRHDKFNPENSHLIPAIISKIHEAKKTGVNTVEIWGDGIARREFMYAGDLADAILRATHCFETLPSVMNLGIGRDYSINEYYSAVADVVGFKGDFAHNLSKPVGMARKLVDIKLQEKWGWSASTKLYEGVEKTYQYFLTNYTAIP